MDEKLKHREAFEFYYSLNESRTLKVVAERFKCSLRAVEEWSSAFKWQEKIIERDNEIADLVEKKLKKQVVEQKVKYHNLLQNILAPVIKGLQFMRLKSEEEKLKFKQDNPEMVVIQVASVAEFERLIKLDLLLIGEETDRLGVNEYQTIKDLVSKVGGKT